MLFSPDIKGVLYRCSIPMAMHICHTNTRHSRRKALRGYVLCNAMNFNNLENSVGRMSDLVQTQFMQTSQYLASVGYENLRNFADTQAAMKDGNYALSSQLANCCCENKQAVADLKYSNAMNTASINENTTAGIQKILDTLSQNKIESLQAQVSELKTQQMFCGIPRISPYGYGVVPQFATNPCACGVAF